MAYKNLVDQEGIEKLKELVKSADICMFASHYTDDSLSARPMSTQEVDDDGVLWFFSQASSNINAEIEIDSRVQLFYANKAKSEYLSLSGKATIIKDEQKAKVRLGKEHERVLLLKNIFYRKIRKQLDCAGNHVM